MPIRFVDRVEGKSKMSTYIVVEALLLVTWWSFKRIGRLLVRGRPRGMAAAHHLRVRGRARQGGRPI